MQQGTELRPGMARWLRTPGRHGFLLLRYRLRCRRGSIIGSRGRTGGRLSGRVSPCAQIASGGEGLYRRRSGGIQRQGAFHHGRLASHQPRQRQQKAEKDQQPGVVIKGAGQLFPQKPPQQHQGKAQQGAAQRQDEQRFQRHIHGYSSTLNMARSSSTSLLLSPSERTSAATSSLALPRYSLRIRSPVAQSLYSCSLTKGL